jgi:hypothetical protein
VAGGVVPRRADVEGLRARLDLARTGRVRWSAGVRSERATSRLLESLEPRGFVVLQLDDHLVLGPTGVWLVASRHFPYPLSLGHRGGLWTGWHPVGDVLEGLAAAAAAVGRALDVDVAPVVAVHTGAVPGRRLVNAGVHVVDAGRALLPLLRDGPTVLSSERVAALAARGPAAYVAARGRRGPDPSA